MTSLCISLFFLTQISWIASALGMASKLMYVALGVSFCATMLLLMILIRPHFIGRLAIRLERTFLGRFLAKVSGAHDWAPKLHRWSHRLRANVRTLWSEKTWVMVLDTLLGVGNTFLHAYSLQFVLEGVVGLKLSFLAVLITYVILWQVVFYVPTPGASGSVEGAFALVFAGMTNALGRRSSLSSSGGLPRSTWCFSSAGWCTSSWVGRANAAPACSRVQREHVPVVRVRPVPLPAG